MQRMILVTIFILSLYSLSGINQKFTGSAYDSYIHDDKISADSLFNLLSNFNDYPSYLSTGDILSFENQVADTIFAPFYVYLPENYDNTISYPLIILLHGGVNRKDFPADMLDGLNSGYNEMLDYDTKGQFIHLIPTANSKTMWWDNNGIDNILDQIRFLKRYVNVDDDRVYLTGGSDGGSGTYFFLLRKPNTFAAGIPHIGMINVGNYVTGKGVHITNLKNRFVYAVNTDKDQLYPAKRSEKIMELLLKADVGINYQERNGYGHETGYMSDEIQSYYDFFNRSVRNPLKSIIEWECSDLESSECDWIEITGIDTNAVAADWHKVYQDSIPEERIQFGFFPDMKFEGKGIGVDKLSEGDFPARLCGLKSGDVIIKMDNFKLESLDDLDKAKESKKRGDDFTLTVKRDGKKVKLEGKFPEVEYYPMFLYPAKSAKIKAKFYANTFQIETSRVASFEIKIHPDMVQLVDPVKIILNGEEVYNQKIGYDKAYMLDNFKENYDKKALWINRISVDVE